MSVYRPFSSAVEKLRLLFQRRIKDGQIAYLGNGSGVVEVPGRPGYVYARFPGGKDANGFAQFGPPFMVRSGNASYINAEGSTVYVAWGYGGEPEIVSAHYQEMDAAGIDTRVLNRMSQQSKWVYPWQLTYALPSAVANNFVNAFLVTVKKLLHYAGNTFQYFETNDESEMIDLESYVPAVDMHRYAALWLDTYTNTIEVTTSTAQSLFTPLDITDIQELVTNRPADSAPLKAFYLSNDQATLKQSINEVDLRQWLNYPEPFGLPNPIAYRERIRTGYQQLYAGILVTTGELVVDGELIGLVDCCGGGSGGMESFIVAADSGGPTTVEDGDTLSVLGGTGIDTSLSGLMLTLAIDSTVVTLTGSQTLTNKTLTAPVIADFTNAQHDHLDADDGGTLSASAIASGTLNIDRIPALAATESILNLGSDLTTSGTSFASIDTTNLSLTITTTGRDVLIGFVGSISNSGTGFTFFDVLLDNSARIAGDDGFTAAGGSAGVKQNISFGYIHAGLSAGSHNFKLQWRVNTGTTTLFAGAGSTNGDIHPQFYVRELY